MAHEFTKPLERLGDPRRLDDVSRLISGGEEGHKVTNQFYYKGVLILEILSANHVQKTKMNNNNDGRKRLSEVKRRILILGHTVDSDDMVALRVKNKTRPWITHSFSFGSEKVSSKDIHHPRVAWCKSLAMIHTGSSFAKAATNDHRMKQATELMQLACDNSVAWHDLDFHALKVR